MKLLAQGLEEDVTPPKVVMLNFLLKQVSTSKRASQLKKNAKEIIAWEVAGGRHHGRSVKDRSRVLWAGSGSHGSCLCHYVTMTLLPVQGKAVAGR